MSIEPVHPQKMFHEGSGMTSGGLTGNKVDPKAIYDHYLVIKMEIRDAVEEKPERITFLPALHIR